MHNQENHRGEIVFRVCAYALTGLQCSFLVLIFILLSFFLYGLLPGGTVYSTKGGYTFYGVLHSVFFILMLIIPNILGWFLSFLYPLKQKSQTWGMKMFGLKAIHKADKQLSWKSSFLQEGLQTFTCSFIIGLPGIIWALFNKQEKTVFNQISGISIQQVEPRLAFVREFREYRNQKV